jgi:Ca-activated chloride channel family protein
MQRHSIVFFAILSLVLVTYLLAERFGNREPGRLAILASPKQVALAPLIERYCRAEGWECEMNIQSSVNILLALQAGDTSFDAVWPAQSHWIELGNSQGQVQHRQSIHHSAVVLGVRNSELTRLGWSSEAVRMADILAAVEQRGFRFLMPSASQSDTGLSAYVTMLTALAAVERLGTADLADEGLQDAAKTLLSGVQRSAGSANWLAQLYLERADDLGFNAIWSQEALLLELNERLVKSGREPLTLIYPSDGIALNDNPLGFIQPPDHDAAKEAFFLSLQAHLRSSEVQEALMASGWRSPSGEDLTAASDENSRPALTPIRFPEAAVTQAAIELYQVTLRKPSLLGLCLDYSGSMRDITPEGGSGEAQLETALAQLFDPTEAARHLLAATPQDRYFALPFDRLPRRLYQARGDHAAVMIAQLVEEQEASDRTDLYACLVEVYRAMAGLGDLTPYNLGIIVMTDGLNDADRGRFARLYARGGLDIPIFSIPFGQAEPGQLEALAGQSGGRLFTIESDLLDAFRQARGYL